MVTNMLCPYCQADNAYDSLVCDSCYRELPMSKSRIEEIKQKKKIEKRNKLNNSIIKIIGLVLGLLAIILVIVIAWIRTRG